jgi:hypothetical protein
MAGPDAGTMAEVGCSSSAWYVTRHSACISGLGYTLEVYAITENGGHQLIGQIGHTITTSNVTSGESTRWTHRISMHVGLDIVGIGWPGPDLCDGGSGLVDRVRGEARADQQIHHLDSGAGAFPGVRR